MSNTPRGSCQMDVQACPFGLLLAGINGTSCEGCFGCKEKTLGFLVLFEDRQDFEIKLVW